MLLLPLVLIGFISKASGFDDLNLKDYITGSKMDAKGRTINHLVAENCHDLYRFKLWMKDSEKTIEKEDPNFDFDDEFYRKKSFQSIKDRDGRTAFDIAAEKALEESENTECIRMMRHFHRRMIQDLEKKQHVAQ